MLQVIKPSVGRKVWFLTSAQHALDVAQGRDQPLDATVLFVHDDRCINVKVTDHHGNDNFVAGITLAQEGDTVNGPHCQWMPYQTKQAAKAEADAPEALGDTAFFSSTGKDAATLIGEALREPEASATVSESSDTSDHPAVTAADHPVPAADLGTPL